MSDIATAERASRNPAEIIIQKFGGLSGMARAYPMPDGSPRPVTTVQSWRDRGRIPQDHWIGIQEAGERQGLEIALSEFLAAESSAAA